MSPARGTIVCADCGKSVPKTGNTQKYCRECSSVRDRARKAKLATAHPSQGNPTERRKRAAERKSEIVAQGAEIAEENAASISGWMADSGPDLQKLVRVFIPFDYAGSKNAVWRTGRGGHVYAREEGKRIRAGLTLIIKSASTRSRTQWHQGKVWLDIFIEKPDNRGDATNFVDMICDAVKDAIGVDDRWFAIRRLDWAIVKKDPRIIVGIGQEITEDHQACSHCGRILPLDRFGVSRAAKNGRVRECKDCLAAARRHRKNATGEVVA